MPSLTKPPPSAAFDLDAMRLGLQAGEFFLEYMPTVSLVDGRCIGAEALVRWRRPSGVLNPAEFIPAAENTPLSGLITYWVIDRLAEEMGAWLRENPEAHLSINVPPEILGRGGMEYVATKSGLIDVARQLILEITERSVPDPMGVDALGNIWGVRVRVALDDVTFVGGANLAVLARCPFDFIKLDRSLIAQIQPGAPKPGWMDGIASMLRASTMTVIAEGVETDAQLAALRGIGMPAAQGYLFARPMPAVHFIDYHRKMCQV